MLAIFATIAVNVEQVLVLPLPLQSRRRTRMGNILRKAGRPEETGHPEKRIRCRAEITLKEFARTRHALFWRPPACPNYKSQSGCKFGEKSWFLTERDGQTAKERKEGWREKARGPFTECETIGMCTSRCGAAESQIEFPEGYQFTETNTTCTIYVKSFKIRTVTGKNTITRCDSTTPCSPQSHKPFGSNLRPQASPFTKYCVNMTSILIY